MPYGDVEYLKKEAIELFDKIAKKATDAINELESAKKSFAGGGVIPLHPSPWRNSMISPKSYKTPELAKAEYKKLFDESIKIHKQNVPAGEHNEKAKKAVMSLLLSIGLKTTETKINSRGKRIDDPALWVSSVNSQFPISNGYSQESLTREYEQHLREITAWEKEIASIENNKQREIEKENAKKLQWATIGKFASKYGCEPTIEAYDLLLEILTKNKYLHLAHYMMKNRGDWSDWHSYAEIGYNFFKAESPRDKEIKKCVGDAISDWDGDGRVFRDIEWNYDRIFAIVAEESPELYADYNEIMTVAPD